MEKRLLVATAVAAAFLLSGCSTTTKPHVKKISATKLADGSYTTMGYQKAKPDWGCVQLDKRSGNWQLYKMEGVGGGFLVLQKKAIAYANHKHLKPNYIYLDVPQVNRVLGWDLSPFDKASAVYYRCKNPPAKYDHMF